MGGRYPLSDGVIYMLVFQIFIDIESLSCKQKLLGFVTQQNNRSDIFSVEYVSFFIDSEKSENIIYFGYFIIHNHRLCLACFSLHS